MKLPMRAPRGGPLLWSAAARKEHGEAAGHDAPAKPLSLETGAFEGKLTERGKGRMGVAPSFFVKRADKENDGHVVSVTTIGCKDGKSSGSRRRCSDTGFHV